MAHSVHVFRVFSARKTSHPVFPNVFKYWFTVPAKDLPSGISTAANARDPVGMNRRVYRDVKDSLLAEASQLGSFDLMNKGITILAADVKLLNKDKGEYEVHIDDDIGGIVDGAHTARIIAEAQAKGSIPAEQHVEVYIRTNIAEPLITDISRGLNTSVQVAPKSIYNIDGVFDWLKDEVANTPYANMISWKESDVADYDVRDLIGILELFNVFTYGNDIGKMHPIAAYEKWSAVLERFADDFEQHRTNISESTYHKLRGIFREGLALWDHVRRDFYVMHNSNGGAAGKMNIVEEAPPKPGVFNFPFAGLEPHQYRLTKGAAFPILGAFRNFVVVNPVTGNAEWRGGFDAVLAAWKTHGPHLVAQTFNATKDYGRNPDQLGKNRQHWLNLHQTVNLIVMKQMFAELQQQTVGGA